MTHDAFGAHPRDDPGITPTLNSPDPGRGGVGN
jgi:hypothetical protein